MVDRPRSWIFRSSSTWIALTPLLGGVLLDNYPGAEGYRYFFLATAGFCAIGLLFALIIYLKYVRRRVKPSG